MLVIRLSRIGRKGEAKYKIIVKEKRSKRDGSAVDVIGYYEKGIRDVKKSINSDKLSYWKSKGAKLSQAVENLLVNN